MSNEDCTNYDYNDDNCRGNYCEICAFEHSKLVNEIQDKLFDGPVLVELRSGSSDEPVLVSYTRLEIKLE